MAHHKYKKPRHGRASCKLCKPNKSDWMNEDKEVGNNGFGKIRDNIHTLDDLLEWNNCCKDK